MEVESPLKILIATKELLLIFEEFTEKMEIKTSHRLTGHLLPATRLNKTPTLVCELSRIVSPALCVLRSRVERNRIPCLLVPPMVPPENSKLTLDQI